MAISKPEDATWDRIPWNFETGTFDISKMPKEMRMIFKKAGIRKKDLGDKNTALII